MTRRAQPERRRAFRPAGLRVVFALLCRPELAEEDYRTLAKEVDVALGTVQRVMRELIEGGYVLRLGRDRRRLVEPKALLDAWTPAYIRDLRPALLLGRFEAPRLDWWQTTKVGQYRALWGGEPAATLWTREGKKEAAPPVLVYADLLATADARAIEAAEQIFRERIDGPFTPGGLEGP